MEMKKSELRQIIKEELLKEGNAVSNLLKDIENEIWEFQSESDEEDVAIIKGLMKIIAKIKKGQI